MQIALSAFKGYLQKTTVTTYKRGYIFGMTYEAQFNYVELTRMFIGRHIL